MAGKRQIIRPKVYNIVVVGEPRVGKTAIIQRVRLTAPLPSQPTTIKAAIPNKTNPPSRPRSNPLKFIFNNFVDYDDPTICEDYRKQIILSNRAALLEIAEPIGTAGTRMGVWGAADARC